MKTSIVLVVLIFLNTSALLIEPLLSIIKGVNSWWFIGAEIVLLTCYYLNQVFKGLNVISQVDLNNLNLFVIKDPNKNK